MEPGSGLRPHCESGFVDAVAGLSRKPYLNSGIRLSALRFGKPDLGRIEPLIRQELSSLSETLSLIHPRTLRRLSSAPQGGVQEHIP